jgi:CDP-diacylglycerol--serine O-phosphatidyltransferase
MAKRPDPDDKVYVLPDRDANRSEFALIQLLPNLMTLTAICLGMAAIRFGMEGRHVLAVTLILMAAVLDGLDGRVARYLRSESLIGAELDSLADFLNFGVAPALIVFSHAFPQGSEIGWVAALAYALACVLRLARFNVTSSMTDSPVPKGQFQGVPSPAGAGLAMVPLYYDFLRPDHPALPELLVAAYLVLIGGLMISRMPTPSLKSIRLPRRFAGVTLVLVAALGLAMYFSPWAVLLTVSLAYLGVLGFSALQAWRSRV